jgi:hypothetical protein
LYICFGIGTFFKFDLLSDAHLNIASPVCSCRIDEVNQVQLGNAHTLGLVIFFDLNDQVSLQMMRGQPLQSQTKA